MPGGEQATKEDADIEPASTGKNIVVCCDGTGNEVAGDISNVLKLFRIARKNDGQRVYYHPGVGTIGEETEWTRRLQGLRAVWGLATGVGLDDNILEAYRFIARVYEDGDRIFLFGFSRGAYTARALAGFIHMMGLLRPDQLNIAGYALTTYKRSGGRHEDREAAMLKSARAVAAGGVGAVAVAAPGEPLGDKGRAMPAANGTDGAKDPFQTAWDFARTAGARRATVHFVGVWDTVASMLVPRPDRLGIQLRTLPYTRRNPSVRAFRHAMAIDERRRMFRLNRWDEGQTFVANPFAEQKVTAPQDCSQLWFAGVHSDIGGGYREAESALSKPPLIWMTEEAVKHGLKIDRAMLNHLAHGVPRKGATHSYVAPDPCGPMHDSLTGLRWRALEYFPKSARWREWRRGVLGLYLPRGEPRVVEPEATLHPSVEARRAGCAYDPVNLRERRRFLPPEGPVGPIARKVWAGLLLLALIAGIAWLVQRRSEHRRCHHQHERGTLCQHPHHGGRAN